MQDATCFSLSLDRAPLFPTLLFSLVMVYSQRPQEDGVTSMILDLRSNPGGLVQSAAEVARLFLDGHPTLFTVSGRAGEQLQEVALDDGTSVTHAPLAVLVDHGSASASEILSGALHDNHRAIVIGDEKTYGKGRIQSVFEMVGCDSALLWGVFVAGYGGKLTVLCTEPAACRIESYQLH